jgi:hypothetical protein
MNGAVHDAVAHAVHDAVLHKVHGVVWRTVRRAVDDVEWNVVYAAVSDTINGPTPHFSDAEKAV